MNEKLKIILEAVTSVEAALLRFRNDEGQHNLQVKIGLGNGNSVNCVVTGEIPAGMKMANGRIHLIQKYRDDYFVISGYFLEELQETSKIFSVVISKACWFIRKSKGSVSWLREKYIYENKQEIMQEPS